MARRSPGPGSAGNDTSSDPKRRSGHDRQDEQRQPGRPRPHDQRCDPAHDEGRQDEVEDEDLDERQRAARLGRQQRHDGQTGHEHEGEGEGAPCQDPAVAHVRWTTGPERLCRADLD